MGNSSQRASPVSGGRILMADVMTAVVLDRAQAERIAELLEGQADALHRQGSLGAWMWSREAEELRAAILRT